MFSQYKGKALKNKVCFQQQKREHHLFLPSKKCHPIDSSSAVLARCALLLLKSGCGSKSRSLLSEHPNPTTQIGSNMGGGIPFFTVVTTAFHHSHLFPPFFARPRHSPGGGARRTCSSPGCTAISSAPPRPGPPRSAAHPPAWREGVGGSALLALGAGSARSWRAGGSGWCVFVLAVAQGFCFAS